MTGASRFLIGFDHRRGGDIRHEAALVIIGPQTGNLLASEGIVLAPAAGAAPGTVLYYTAYLGQHWTDRLPPGLRS